MRNVPKKITIIGVGFIGGSIALGLKNRFGNHITMSGYCSRPNRAQKAKKLGIIDNVITLKTIPKDTELLVLATPVLTAAKLLGEIQPQIRQECIVIDVGSTKEFICKIAAQKKFNRLRFIGTHPMAGSECSGFECSDGHLFRNKAWIICPKKKTGPGDINTIQALITSLEANPIQMTPKLHDESVSLVSHLPLSLASILAHLVTKDRFWKMGKQIASSGFRETTRLASFDPHVKTDILLTNRENTTLAIRKMRSEIDIFLKLLEKEKRMELIRYFIHAKQKRDQWLSEYSS